MSVRSFASAPVDGFRSPSPPRRRRVSHSPPPRRGRRGGVTVERVIKETSGSVQYPTLTRTNYQDWSLLMRVNLQAAGLWHAVEPEPDEIVEYREDRLAMAAILRSVPSDMLGSLARKRTARSAWEAVKTVRMGVERVREASARQLLKEFGEITFRDGELVDDFALRITGLANNIRTLGGKVDDTDVVKKMIQVAPPHLEQIAYSIETLLDVNTLSVEELTGRPRAIEQRKKKPPPSTLAPKGPSTTSKVASDGGGGPGWPVSSSRKALFGGNSGGATGDKKKRGKPRRGRGGSTKSGDARDDDNKVAPDRRPNCGKKGHWAKDCRSKKKAAQAHVAEGDEEDTTPLMATTVISVGEAAPAAVDPGAPVPHRVRLLEAKFVPRLDAPEERDDSRWILDTGASNHMTGVRSLFSELDRRITGSVRFGDGSTVAIEGRGTIVFAARTGSSALSPGSTTSLARRRTSSASGRWTKAAAGSTLTMAYCASSTAEETARAGRPYQLQATVGRPACFALHGAEDTWRRHGRFGHLGFDNLRKLAKDGLVRGLPQTGAHQQGVRRMPCRKAAPCSLPRPGTATRCARPRPRSWGPRGPITPSTPGGNGYFLLLVDDMSRFMWIKLIAGKDEAASAIKNFQAAVEVESGCRLKVLRTDRGGEFTSVEFSEYRATRGVRRQLTAPYSPQQNGVVERRNPSIVVMARCMLKSKGLPGRGSLHRRLHPQRIADEGACWPTPYEAWHGERPAVHFMRTFGCIAHVKNTRPHLNKLEDRSSRTIFVGYEPGSKAYRCYNPATARVVVSRDVIFDEEASWTWDAAPASTEQDAEPFIVEYEQAALPGSARGSPEGAATPGSARGSPPPRAMSSPAASTTPAATPALGSHSAAPTQPASPTAAASPSIEFVSPPSDPEGDLDADHDDEAPLRFRAIDTVLGPASPPGLAPRVLDEELLFTTADEPATFAEASARSAGAKL
ncbi:hypothetical protein U9M48_039226 [Paspalum notatum var. saurae]|uniref:Integrase catalytic domain-containing protein n=1 Tax=Paspalum notatum var. saurae TaxID=547442 RepID=A0AAQ3UII0_PASNO